MVTARKIARTFGVPGLVLVVVALAFGSVGAGALAPIGAAPESWAVSRHEFERLSRQVDVLYGLFAAAGIGGGTLGAVAMTRRAKGGQA